jgi:hypothetical protein
MVWLTFNIPTLAFMIPFVNGIKTRKTNKLLQEAAMEAAQDEDVADESAE